jgi:hypothetical protein
MWVGFCVLLLDVCDLKFFISAGISGHGTFYLEWENKKSS